MEGPSWVRLAPTDPSPYEQTGDTMAAPQDTELEAVDEPEPFVIGVEVSCSDGVCGELTRVVLDPVARRLTHLVVEPKHRHEVGRLVPVDLVDPAAAAIGLHCTTAVFATLPTAEESQFLPEWNEHPGYRSGQILAWPYYGLRMGAGTSMGGGAVMGPARTDSGPLRVTHDRVPLGEVQVHRGEHVHTTDGTIGHVQGLVVHPGDHLVSHVLLDEGHLWGKRSVAIPIGAVTGVTDGVRLNLTKDEVRDLPPVDLDQL